MRRSVVLLSVLLLAASRPALAQYGGGGGDGGGMASGPSDDDKPSFGDKTPADPFSAAMAIKQKGDVPRAMTLLRKLADRGPGYEVAQFELGKIYYELANGRKDVAAAQADRTHGFGWMLVAAKGGLGTAQAKLVQVCLDGDGTPASRVEAAKWYLLWRQNPSRMQLGTSRFDELLERRLKAQTSQADWADAQQRAISFYQP